MSIHQKLSQIAAESTAYFGATPEKWYIPNKRVGFNKIVLFVFAAHKQCAAKLIDALYLKRYPKNEVDC